MVTNSGTTSTCNGAEAGAESRSCGCRVGFGEKGECAKF